MSLPTEETDKRTDMPLRSSSREWKLKVATRESNTVTVTSRKGGCYSSSMCESIWQFWQESVSLDQAIASSLSMNCLPVPEPTTFSGDPLSFTDWKMSFVAMIDQKTLPASESYLKNDFAGEARKFVEGFFYLDSENAHDGAWKVFQDRYGNPFIIQKAFRDKLMKWHVQHMQSSSPNLLAWRQETKTCGSNYV